MVNGVHSRDVLFAWSSINERYAGWGPNGAERFAYAIGALLAAEAWCEYDEFAMVIRTHAPGVVILQHAQGASPSIVEGPSRGSSGARLNGRLRFDVAAAVRKKQRPLSRSSFWSDLSVIQDSVVLDFTGLTKDGPDAEYAIWALGGESSEFECQILSRLALDSHYEGLSYSSGLRRRHLVEIVRGRQPSGALAPVLKSSDVSALVGPGNGLHLRAELMSWARHGLLDVVTTDSRLDILTECVVLEAPDNDFAVAIPAGYAEPMNERTLAVNAFSRQFEEVCSTEGSQMGQHALGVAIGEWLLGWAKLRAIAPHKASSEMMFSQLDDGVRKLRASSEPATTLRQKVGEVLCLHGDPHAHVVDHSQKFSVEAVGWVHAGELYVRRVWGSATNLSPGDKIVRVDGEPWADIRLRLAPKAGGDARAQELIAAYLGLVGSAHDATIVVERAGGEEVEICAPRVPMRWPLPLPPAHNAIQRLANGVVYFNVGRLTSEDLDQVGEMCTSEATVVLDCRSWIDESIGFGLLRELGRATTGSRGRHVSWSRSGSTVSYRSVPTALVVSAPVNLEHSTTAAPLYVLTDRDTISGGEVVALAARDMLGGVLVGEGTPGSGGLATEVLIHEFAVSMTCAAFESAVDGCGFRKPAAPHVPIETTPTDLRAGRDPVFEWCNDDLRAE